jgi:hypothetical protein
VWPHGTGLPSVDDELLRAQTSLPVANELMISDAEQP